MQLFEEKGEGRSGRVWGSERLGEGAQLTRRAGQGRQGKAGRAQAGCRAQGAGAGHRGQGRVARFHFEVSRPENLKNNIFATLGQGQGPRAGLGRAQGRGAGRLQGTGRRGRAIPF